MTRYAENTTVSVEKSRAEIESTLARYGASSFAYGWDQSRALIEFAAQGRRIRFVIDLPAKDDPAFTTYKRGQYGSVMRRTPEAALAQWEQACRQRWRVLALVIKAKLEAVASGISEFEEEFLAHVVLPNGETAGQWIRPQIARAYETGEMPPMLPQLGSGR